MIPSPVIPPQSVSKVLLLNESQGVESLYEAPFTVPALLGAGVPLTIELATEVNVTCGGLSPYLGADFACVLSLVSGLTGGPTENLLWQRSFTGPTGSNVSSLVPGVYTALVHVQAGSPPLAVLIVPFSVVLEVAVLR